MSVQSTTHLNFRGEARAALNFYQTVFGGDLMIVTYGDLGHVPTPAETDHVVWGQVTAPSGFRVMAYDVASPLPFERGENSFFVSLRGNDADEVAGLWEKLAEGATVVQPLGASAWSALYGMLKDKFGVVWVLDVESGYGG